MILTQAEIKKISAVIGLIIGLVTVGGIVTRYISNDTRRKIMIEQSQQQIQEINLKVDSIVEKLNEKIDKINEKFQNIKINEIEMKQKVTSSEALLIELKDDMQKFEDEVVNLKIVQHDLAKLEK